MPKRLTFLLLGIVLTVSLMGAGCSRSQQTIIAVEFNNHAACAYVAYDKGWFEEAGLTLLPIFQVYESGTAIAGALTRGDIQVGYLGLTGVILAYERGAPITVIAGIQQYGYGLVAKPEITEVSELSGKTIGSLREGTVTDILLKLMIDSYQLKDLTIRRMSPSEAVLALISGSLDAAFIPEQHATTAEANGFPMLLRSQDLWPGMQGDVLVVRTELIRDNPELVTELMAITQRATDWIREHPGETAEIMVRQLQVARGKLSPVGTLGGTGLELTPEIIARSMERIIYSTSIDPSVVQQTIDYMASFGYVRQGIKAADMLDLSFLAQVKLAQE